MIIIIIESRDIINLLIKTVITYYLSWNLIACRAANNSWSSDIG